MHRGYKRAAFLDFLSSVQRSSERRRQVDFGTQAQLQKCRARHDTRAPDSRLQLQRRRRARLREHRRGRELRRRGHAAPDDAVRGQQGHVTPRERARREARGADDARPALTDEGIAFHERCRRALELLADAAEEVSSGARAMRGTIRLGLPPLFGTHFVPRVLPALLAVHPDLRIELVSTMRVADLIDQRLDLLIAVGELRDSSFVARPLGYGQFVVVGSPAYLARAGAPRSPADLATHRCLAFGSARHDERSPALRRHAPPRSDGERGARSGSAAAVCRRARRRPGSARQSPRRLRARAKAGVTRLPRRPYRTAPRPRPGRRSPRTAGVSGARGKARRPPR
jgi:DNA-binding transcriptional LysR family regulator